MKCPDRDCVAEYVTGGRRHECVFRSLGGFTLGDPVVAVHSGDAVGTVSRLERTGRRVSVSTRLPGQIVPSHWMDHQLRVVVPDAR